MTSEAHTSSASPQPIDPSLSIMCEFVDFISEPIPSQITVSYLQKMVELREFLDTRDQNIYPIDKSSVDAFEEMSNDLFGSIERYYLCDNEFTIEDYIQSQNLYTALRKFYPQKADLVISHFINTLASPVLTIIQRTLKHIFPNSDAKVPFQISPIGSRLSILNQPITRQKLELLQSFEASLALVYPAISDDIFRGYESIRLIFPDKSAPIKFLEGISIRLQSIVSIILKSVGDPLSIICVQAAAYLFSRQLTEEHPIRLLVDSQGLTFHSRICDLIEDAEASARLITSESSARDVLCGRIAPFVTGLYDVKRKVPAEAAANWISRTELLKMNIATICHSLICKNSREFMPVVSDFLEQFQDVSVWFDTLLGSVRFYALAELRNHLNCYMPLMVSAVETRNSENIRCAETEVCSSFAMAAVRAIIITQMGYIGHPFIASALYPELLMYLEGTYTSFYNYTMASKNSDRNMIDSPEDVRRVLYLVCRPVGF